MAVTVLDYTVSFGGGRNLFATLFAALGTALGCTVPFGLWQAAAGYRQTVVFLPSALQGLPAFVLYPRSMFDRFSQYVSELRIEVPGEPEFNKGFAVRGQDRERVLACITPAARELCRKAGNLYIEVQDGLLAVFRQNKLARPEDYPELVAQALRLADALQPGP